MRVPPLLAGLVDDATLLPAGAVTPRQALAGHLAHRTAWYSELVGPLLLPASRLDEVVDLVTVDRVVPEEMFDVGVVGDAGPAPAGLSPVAAAIAAVGGRLPLRQIEVPVAMRNEDPLPGLRAVLDLDTALDGSLGGDRVLYAEIPLTWGLLASLDRLAEARSRGAKVAPKFRTGGLAAELFPTPVELAAVICACRDRELPFKLAAGVHRAIRRTDPETGLVTHGFLNILGAVLAAAAGAEPVDLAEILGGTDPLPVVEAVKGRLAAPRPLWSGFGSSSLPDPLADLRALGLLPALGYHD